MPAESGLVELRRINELHFVTGVGKVFGGRIDGVAHGLLGRDAFSAVCRRHPDRALDRPSTNRNVAVPGIARTWLGHHFKAEADVGDLTGEWPLHRHELRRQASP